ncbi:MAG TPA: S41 family peptidase [Thermoanaerobaculaceae bacterium]|nr:S41 family peptidase [Thermoanaerobaculaceae bacterium]HPS79238.1 S41 family peptidase [Thermoanaerobaculaceae bacterium]
MKVVRVTLAAFVLAGGAWAGAATPGYYRYPAISGDTVVFVAEGDLWKVGAEGGVAQRLTTHPGEESRPALSPDGRTLAFSAAYEGPIEVYTMPLVGGLPQRHTWDGGQALVVGWTPDGKVLYATRRYSTLPETQLVTVDPATDTRQVLPLAQASDGMFTPDGTTLFFTRLPFQGSHTKRYKGGMAQQLWRLVPGQGEAAPLTADFPGTSKTPMWWQGRVWFASDRDGTMNLWSMDEHGKDLRQHTHHEGWDVASPSLGSGRIVYQLGADLHRFDCASGQDRLLPIILASDFDQLREKWVDKPMDYLSAAHISASGDRVVLTARGLVFVAPVGKGRLVEVTRRDGVRYRQAHFMPDGKALVALSDESGEVEWWRLPANGVGAPEQLTRGGTALRLDGVPSPDGARLAFVDKNDELWVHEIATGKSARVAASEGGGFGQLAWSPDSRWLAYSVSVRNLASQIMLYRVEDASTIALTSDRVDSDWPAWSSDGKWIYFLSDRNLVSAVPSPWGSRQPEPFVDRPTKVYAVALAPGLRFPFAPADELAPADEGKPAKKAAAGQDDAAAGKPKLTVAIEPKGLADRLWEVPLPAGSYSGLQAGEKRLFLLSFTVGSPDKGALLALEISGKEPKPKTLVEGVMSFEVAAERGKLLVRKGETLAVLEADAGEKADLSEKTVNLADWRFSLVPREEWRQMFREAWRLERDYFYDRGMHGADWPAMLAKYQPLVDRVSDRAELSDVLAKMVSELSALHIFVRGGDLRKGRDNVLPASLGAVLERDEPAGGWRVGHVYASDPDYPDERAPLARPGVEVREGDTILAVNGEPTLKVPDPGVLLRGQAGRQVLLRVKPAAGTPRDVVVTPMTPDEEEDLRYDEWELGRRQRVEQAGGGKLGYVHLRALSASNYTEWARNFYPVFNREGLIIDARHNRGGNIDSWVLEKLLRKAWHFWQPRVGVPYSNMQYAFRGHMVVLVDQRTSSDGEILAEGFRRLGLGKVIGARTWGGEIWLSSNNFLVDGGIATAAETGVYGPEGEWLIEGRGVEPDIEMDNLPAATFRGEDAQLDAAVRHLQERLKEQPVAVPPHPPYPDKSFKP